MKDLQVGDSPETIRILVNHHRQFLAFLERRIGSRAVAEDILQEAFARGNTRVNSLKDGESAVAWFYRTLRNAVADYYRRNGAARRALESFANELEAQECHRFHTGPEKRCACTLYCFRRNAVVSVFRNLFTHSISRAINCLENKRCLIGMENGCAPSHSPALLFERTRMVPHQARTHSDR